MKIIYATEIGFCMGVRRAVSLLDEALTKDEATPIATYGPLVHNPGLVDHYRELGVRVISSPEEAAAGERVVLRAHGVPAAVHSQLAARGAQIIDATCVKVLQSMRKAQEAENCGRKVVLAGDPGHGEMVAVAGALKNPADVIVLASAEEVRYIDAEHKVTLIAQTTFDRRTYDEIAKSLNARIPDCRVEQTICPATSCRQQAIAELAGEVEALIVIGGRNSANTRRLYEIALGSGKPSWQVEGPDELPAELKRYQTIGISAGASTPDSIIEATAEAIYALKRGVSL